MIGKVIVGKSFRGCISYCMENKKQEEQNSSEINRAEVLLFNQCFGNTKALIQQFNEIRQLNQKLSKPVLHITLSFAQGEKLEKSKLINMVQDCAKDFGFENNQFIAITHNDTRHQHVHIVANRIGFDKKTVSDSNSYKMMAAYCRKMEIKYGLQKVLSPKKFLSKELREMPRNDKRKDAIKKDIQDAILISKTYEEFEKQMQQKKYQIIKGRGIAFIDKKGVYVKGSEVGYSLTTIEKLLQRKPEHKQLIISMQREKDNMFKRWQQHSLNQEQKIPHSIKIEFEKVANILLKPEITENFIPNPLLEKKKKKKKKSLSI